MEYPVAMEAFVSSLETLIAKCVAIEASMVEADEYSRLAMQQVKAVRASCEIAVQCAEGNATTGRQAARSTTGLIDLWYELEKQMRARRGR